MSDDVVTGIVQGAMDSLKESGAMVSDPGDEVLSSAAETEIETTPAPIEGDEPVAAVEMAPVAEAPITAAEPAAVAPVADEDADLKAIEAELVAKTPGLAQGKIKSSRHQAVVTRIRREGEKALAAVTEKYKMFDAPDAPRRLGLMDQAESRPKDFFHGVLLKDPVYQGIIQEYVASLAPPAPAAPAAPERPAIVVPETAPEPDEVGPDGSLRYSLDGQRALARYEAAQLTKTLQDRLDKLDGSVKPVLEGREREQRFSEAKTRQREAWTRASETWEGFKAHEQQIADTLLAPGHERMTLDEAYRAVVIPAMKIDPVKYEAEVRAKILAEMAKAPVVPPARLGGNGQAAHLAADPSVPRDTADIIRENLRKLTARQ